MFSNTLMEPMEFNYSHGQHCTRETASSGFKRGQCKTKTVECRLQSAKCRPGVKSRLQTADFFKCVVLPCPSLEADRKQGNQSAIQANSSQVAFYDNNLTNCPLSLFATSHKLQIHGSVHLLTTGV